MTLVVELLGSGRLREDVEVDEVMHGDCLWSWPEARRCEARREEYALLPMSAPGGAFPLEQTSGSYGVPWRHDVVHVAGEARA